MMSSTSRRVVSAWLWLGVIDLLWAIALSISYGRPAMAAFTRVAAVALAPEWMPALAPSATLGVALHFGVAFTWATIYLLLQHRSNWLTGITSTRRGQVAVGIVYGPLIWLVMSALVIPLMTGDSLVISGRWAIQLVGHVFFVGLPVVLGAGGASAPTAGGAQDPLGVHLQVEPRRARHAYRTAVRHAAGETPTIRRKTLLKWLWS